MSNQPIQMEQGPSGMDVETFKCPTCNLEILASNQLTHEVACARLQRQNNQRPPAQPIIRQSSSSANPDQSINVQQRMPIVRREERRIAENKLVVCPNCEQSVREEDLNAHLDQEFAQKELIPCEFCDKAFPVTEYSGHLESCPMRSQGNQNQQRDQSPGRNMAQREAQNQQANRNQSQMPYNQRDRSPQRGSSQEPSGAFSDFLRDMGQNQNRQIMVRQPDYSPSISLNPGLNNNPFMPYSFGGNIFPLVQGNRAPTRVVRTMEMGPNGSVIVRTTRVPDPQSQMSQPPMQDPMGLNSMGPFGMLMNMMGGGFPGGMQLMPYGGMQNMAPMAPEERGLPKEVLDNLAVIKYNKELNKNTSSENKSCSICLDEFQEGQDVKFLWCTHRFHKNCVDQWLDKHTTCPVCKKDYSEAEQGFSP